MLCRDLEDEQKSDQAAGLDEESSTWLAADLASELPEYDWGAAGIPEGLPVRYEPGQDVVVVADEA